MNKFTKIIFVLFFAPVLSGCLTLKNDKAAKTKPVAVLIEHQERMFWEIKTEKSSIFILGTIHVADRNFFPLEDKILQAFDKADRLVSEIGGVENIERANILLQKKIMKGINFEPEKNLKNFLQEKDIILIQNEFGEEMSNMFFMLEPWVLNLTLINEFYQKLGLNSEEGIDLHLIKRAGNKTVEALESVETQFSLVCLGTFEEQLEILKETLKVISDEQTAFEEMETIKKLYLNNSREELKDFILKFIGIPDVFSTGNSAQFVDEFLLKRNIAWAEKFKQYLNMGGNTFVFAGVAHFLGDESVFAKLEESGFLALIK